MAPRGRPPKYTKPEDMQKAIDEYFDLKHAEKKLPTVCGLALAIGFVSRTALLDYSQKDDFNSIIKEAKLRIEAALEDKLLNDPTGKITGVIFNLKANFRWRDTIEVEHTGDLVININNKNWPVKEPVAKAKD